MTDDASLPTTRALDDGDRDVLARATLGNVNWSGSRFTLEDVLRTPELAHYFTPWPADRDFGLVVEDPAGTAIAVTWLRHLPADDPGYGFVDESTPELSIWVAPTHRGRGLGAHLLVTLLHEARSRGIGAVSLSVESGNPARALYEKLGFVAAGAELDASTLLLRL